MKPNRIITSIVIFLVITGIFVDYVKSVENEYLVLNKATWGTDPKLPFQWDNINNRWVVYSYSGKEWKNPSEMRGRYTEETNFLQALSRANSRVENLKPTATQQEIEAEDLQAYNDGLKAVADVINSGQDDVHENIYIEDQKGNNLWGDTWINTRVQSEADVAKYLYKPTTTKKIEDGRWQLVENPKWQSQASTDDSYDHLVFNKGTWGGDYELPFRFNNDEGVWQVKTDNGFWVNPKNVKGRYKEETAFIDRLSSANDARTHGERFDKGVEAVVVSVNSGSDDVQENIYIEKANGDNLWGDSWENTRIQANSDVADMLSKPKDRKSEKQAEQGPSSGDGSQTSLDKSVDIQKMDLARRREIEQAQADIDAINNRIEKNEGDPSENRRNLESTVKKRDALIADYNKWKSDNKLKDSNADSQKAIISLNEYNSLDKAWRQEIEQIDNQMKSVSGRIEGGEGNAADNRKELESLMTQKNEKIKQYEEWKKSKGVTGSGKKILDPSKVNIVSEDEEGFLVLQPNGQLDFLKRSEYSLPEKKPEDKKGEGGQSDVKGPRIIDISKRTSNLPEGRKPTTEDKVSWLFYQDDNGKRFLIPETDKNKELLSKASGNNYRINQKQFEFIQEKYKGGYILTYKDGRIETDVLEDNKKLRIQYAIDEQGSKYEIKSVEVDGKTHTFTTITNDDSKIGNSMEYNNIRLPYSPKFSLDPKKGLTYGGRPIKADESSKDNEGKPRWFVYNDEKKGFVIFTEKVILEKDEAGGAAIMREGKPTIRLKPDEANRIIGEKPTLTFVDNLPVMLDAAKNNRIDRGKLEGIANEQGEQIGVKVSGEPITIQTDKDGNVIYLKGDEGKKELALTQITYDKDGRIVESYTRLADNKGEMRIKWVYKGEEKEGTTQDSIEITGGGLAGTYTQQKIDGVGVWCQSGNSPCINLDDGKIYEVADGKLSEVQGYENEKEQLKKNLEARRVGSGGPNNAELGMRRIFNVLESAQTGFGKLFSLLIGDDELKEWRNDVDEFFCDTILLGGKDCWTSKLCEEKLDKIPNNVLVVETPRGTTDIVAHVEGERYDVSYEENGALKKEYLYKLSFAARNPKKSGANVRFNVRLDGEKKIFLYKDWVPLKEGKTISRAGKKMLVEYSKVRYDRICLISPRELETATGETKRELCNKIVPGGQLSKKVKETRAEEADI